MTTAIETTATELEREARRAHEILTALEREAAGIDRARDAAIDAGDAAQALRLEKRKRELPSEIAVATAERDRLQTVWGEARARERHAALEREYAAADAEWATCWNNFSGPQAEAFARGAARVRRALIRKVAIIAELRGDPTLVRTLFAAERHGTAFALRLAETVVDFMTYAPGLKPPVLANLVDGAGAAERLVWRAFFGDTE